MQAQFAFRLEGERRENAKLASLRQNEKAKILQEIVDQSTRNVKRVLAKHFPKPELDREQMKPITEELTLITFAATNKDMEPFEKIKNLRAHKNYGAASAKCS